MAVFLIKCIIAYLARVEKWLYLQSDSRKFC